jgi:tetratricopeptide (TPR) repeat protein
VTGKRQSERSPRGRASAKSQNDARSARATKRAFAVGLALALRIAAPIAASLAVVTIAPTTAAAQGKKPPPPPPPAKDPKLVEAKKLFDDGSQAYTDGRYEDAIKAWEQSYQLSGKPLIFESIANAHERLGDKRKAREYLAKWREAAPKEEQEQLDARIKNLDARIAAADAAEAARKDEEAKRKAEKAEKDKAAQGDSKEREQARSSRMKLALGVGGAGVAVAIAGVVLDVVAAGQRPDPNTVCASGAGKTLCKESAKGGIESSSTLALAGDISWIAGAAIAATGVVLFVTMPSSGATAGKEGTKDAPKTPEKQGKLAPRWMSVAPMVGPTGGGVELRGRF